MSAVFAPHGAGHPGRPGQGLSGISRRTAPAVGQRRVPAPARHRSGCRRAADRKAGKTPTPASMSQRDHLGRGDRARRSDRRQRAEVLDALPGRRAAPDCRQWGQQRRRDCPGTQPGDRSRRRTHGGKSPADKGFGAGRCGPQAPCRDGWRRHQRRAGPGPKPRSASPWAVAPMSRCGRPGWSLLGGDLRGAAGRRLSQTTRRNIRQNLAFAFLYARSPCRSRAVRCIRSWVCCRGQCWRVRR